MLERLDRLTQDEARTTAAHTLVVVHGLVQNMRGFMDGEDLTRFMMCCIECPFSLDGKASIDGIREERSTSCWRRASSAFHGTLDILHQMASEMNKFKRGLFPDIRIPSWKRQNWFDR